MEDLEFKIGRVDFILKTVVSHWRIEAEGDLVRPALGEKSLWCLKWRLGQGKGWRRPRRHSIAFIQLSLRTLDSMDHSLLLESPSLALKTPFYLCFLPTLTVPAQLPSLTFPLFSFKYDCSSRLCPWPLLCSLFILSLDNLFSAQSTKSRSPISTSNHYPELQELWDTERRQ